MKPAHTGSDPITSECVAESTVTIEDFHESESIQEALTNCLIQFQDQVARDLTRLVQHRKVASEDCSRQKEPYGPTAAGHPPGIPDLTESMCNEQLPGYQPSSNRE